MSDNAKFGAKLQRPGTPETDPTTLPATAEVADRPHAGGAKFRRPAPKVLRSWDWAMPSPTVKHREVRTAMPAGWAAAPRAERKPPVLFIHGLAHAAWCFDEHWLPATAAAGFPAYALSFRGHGTSDGADGLSRATLRDYVADVMQVVATLPEPPILVGHSLGSLVAQLVAERYPSRGVVLLTPPPLSGAVPMLLSVGKREPGDVAAALLGLTLPMRPSSIFHGLDEETALSYSRRMGRESPVAQYELLLPHRIGPVRAPVLVVGARNDALVLPSAVDEIAQAYGTSPLWLSEIGHDIMLDVGWDAALDAVLSWIEVAAHDTAGRL